MNGVHSLAKLSVAATALVEATTLEEVKHILDIADAARTYTRTARLGLEAQNHAAELRLRAERKMGDLLEDLERSEGGRPSENSLQAVKSSSEYTSVLEENGINYVTAHRWRNEAKVPDELFEDYIASMIDDHVELTSAGLLKLAYELKQDAAILDHEWTESEVTRRGYVEEGMSVVANMKEDLALVEWAKSMELFERIDRTTVWGNPFLLPADGDRLTVVESYQVYLELKPSLLNKLDSLKGKVLGCWCYPEMCHGEVLEDYANDTAD